MDLTPTIEKFMQEVLDALRNRYITSLKRFEVGDNNQSHRRSRKMLIDYHSYNIIINRIDTHDCVIYYFSLQWDYRGKIELFSATHQGKGIIKDMWDECVNIIENKETEVSYDVPASFDAVTNFLGVYNNK